MSMHLLPCFVTTTNMKKRKQKRSKKQDAVDAAHAKFLKKMGYNGPVVQRSEPAAHNGVVAGSNPAGPTISSVKSIEPVAEKPAMRAQRKTGRRGMRRPVCVMRSAYAMSKRPAFIILVQAATKSFTNFSLPSSWA